MTAVKIEKFDAMTITNASIQFLGPTQQPGKPFGCIGKLDGETEVKEIIKKCEGIETDKISRPQKMNMSVSAHIPVEIARKLFGLSTEGLKPGVWAYGSKSKGQKFVFTADVIDEFQDVKKLIAFANCSSTTGMKFSIENGGDEVAELELEFTAMKDEAGEFYYEAMASEVTDQKIVTDWHTTFNRELVKAVVAPSK